MFPKPDEILAPREGTIAETPLPLLLQAIFAEGRTVALELRLRGLEKRIQFEDGSPVACRSNLLHETLGKFLVEKKKLSEDEYQEALRESVQTGQRMGERLVAKKRLQPFDLYKLMQANLALRILDAFRWTDATWRLAGESEPAELALRMNPAQLVLTGCSGFIPFDVVASSQFQEGLKRLAAGNPRGALEQFQFAVDIEPRPLTRAHLAWARYLVDPERHAKLALGELAEVVRGEPGCARAHFFTGEILRGQGAPAEAEEAYRRAHRADPGERRAQELAIEMMRAKKATK